MDCAIRDEVPSGDHGRLGCFYMQVSLIRSNVEYNIYVVNIHVLQNITKATAGGDLGQAYRTGCNAFNTYKHTHTHTHTHTRTHSDNNYVDLMKFFFWTCVVRSREKEGGAALEAQQIVVAGLCNAESAILQRSVAGAAASEKPQLLLLMQHCTTICC